MVYEAEVLNIVRIIAIGFFVWLFIASDDCFNGKGYKTDLKYWLLKLALWFTCGLLIFLLFITFNIGRI
jgi:hypothetical protein